MSSTAATTGTAKPSSWTSSRPWRAPIRVDNCRWCATTTTPTSTPRSLRGWQNRRITLHFTPTSGSWLNLVEVSFGSSPARPSAAAPSTASRTTTGIRAFIAGGVPLIHPHNHASRWGRWRFRRHHWFHHGNGDARADGDVLSLAGLCPTLRDQLAIQWSFQMGFGHEVWEVTGGQIISFIICSFSNSVSLRPLTCDDGAVSCDVIEHLSQTRVIFSERRYPIPLATYPIGEGRGQPRRKVRHVTPIPELAHA